MIKGSKAREIALRAQYNLYDEQLRTLFEHIEDAAEKGDLSFRFNSNNCERQGLNYVFWFDGARLDTDIWKKVSKVLLDMEYGVKYQIISYPDQEITIMW